MAIFKALSGGKVALYHQAPASGKVLYRPLEQFFLVSTFFFAQNLGNDLNNPNFILCRF
jgi:hypothetical protein